MSPIPSQVSPKKVRPKSVPDQPAVLPTKVPSPKAPPVQIKPQYTKSGRLVKRPDRLGY